MIYSPFTNYKKISVNVSSNQNPVLYTATKDFIAFSDCLFSPAGGSSNTARINIVGNRNNVLQEYTNPTSESFGFKHGNAGQTIQVQGNIQTEISGELIIIEID